MAAARATVPLPHLLLPSPSKPQLLKPFPSPLHGAIAASAAPPQLTASLWLGDVIEAQQFGRCKREWDSSLGSSPCRSRNGVICFHRRLSCLACGHGSREPRDDQSQMRQEAKTSTPICS